MSLDSSMDDEPPEPLPPLLSSFLLQDAKVNIVAATKSSMVIFFDVFVHNYKVLNELLFPYWTESLV